MTIPIQLEWGSAVQLTILHYPHHHHHHPFSDHPHPFSSAVNEKRSNQSYGEVAGIVFPQVTPFISRHNPISLHQGGAKIHDKRLHTITLKQLVYPQLLHGQRIYPNTGDDALKYCTSGVKGTGLFNLWQQ